MLERAASITGAPPLSDAPETEPVAMAVEPDEALETAPLETAGRGGDSDGR